MKWFNFKAAELDTWFSANATTAAEAVDQQSEEDETVMDSESTGGTEGDQNAEASLA
jgi:hypothetical protein